MQGHSGRTRQALRWLWRFLKFINPFYCDGYAPFSVYFLVSFVLLFLIFFLTPAVAYFYGYYEGEASIWYSILLTTISLPVYALTFCKMLAFLYYRFRHSLPLKPVILLSICMIIAGGGVLYFGLLGSVDSYETALFLHIRNEVDIDEIERRMAEDADALFVQYRGADADKLDMIDIISYSTGFDIGSRGLMISRKKNPEVFGHVIVPLSDHVYYFIDLYYAPEEYREMLQESLLRIQSDGLFSALVL